MDPYDMNTRIPDEILKIPGRLTKYDRDEIHAARKAGIPVKQLAKEYRRTPATIQKILRQERSKGFTLVELLIILAFIVALVSILFAGINLARGTKQSAATQSVEQNLGSWNRISSTWSIYYTVVDIHGQRFVVFDKRTDAGNIVVLPFESVELPAEAPDGQIERTTATNH